jgi:hypothetical protein
MNNSGSGSLRNAKATAAVNKDAPIFKAAQDGTAGDLLPNLVHACLLSAKANGWAA